MPITATPNPGSQLDRALREYFRQQGAKPNPGTYNDGIFLTFDNAERTNPLRTIHTGPSKESEAFTGNDEFTVIIVDQFDGHAQTGEKNPEQRRIEIDQQVGKMRACMAQCADGEYDLRQTARNITDAGRSLATSTDPKIAANNTDMAEFTCLWVHPYASKDRGYPDDPLQGGKDETSWKEITTYRIVACPSKVIGYSNTEGE